MARRCSASLICFVVFQNGKSTGIKLLHDETLACSFMHSARFRWAEISVRPFLHLSSNARLAVEHLSTRCSCSVALSLSFAVLRFLLNAVRFSWLSSLPLISSSDCRLFVSCLFSPCVGRQCSARRALTPRCVAA